MKSKLSRLENYTFSDLCDIIGVLRSPEGCPWDREQDHESIRKNFIEETYEVIEAIDDSDTAHLSEELGDVMLQILLHAEMEKEKNNFDIYDVINGISKKLIRRHPHVFGKVSADTPDEVKKNWDAIKRKEKGQNNLKEELEGISRTLPSLMRAQKILKKAKKAGVDICRENDAFDSLDADGFADVLMRLCGAANDKGIDLEEIFDKKCTFEVQNSKNL
ncbi:MAG: MazG family protein [Ruminococcaceae bacterium]|nr:MazG family protein [Oscillospiraceae bacterium]